MKTKHLITVFAIGMVLGVASRLILGESAVYMWLVFLVMTLVGLWLTRNKPKHIALPKKSPEELANEVFDILVEYAGATERDRDYFVGSWGNIEVSFEGNLGKGGKFWINDNRFCNNGKPYINCYPEDLTEERREIIEKVNTLLFILE